MSRKEEFAEKQRRVREFLKSENLDALLLSYQRNFSWFTCGGENRVVTASTEGAASVLITGERDYLITNNIEAPRLLEEEIDGLNLEVVQFPWNQAEKKKELIDEICPQNLGSDDGLEKTKKVDISRLQYSRTEGELNAYRVLGKEVASIVGKTCRTIKAGNSEDEVAAWLSENLLERGIIPGVYLVAADERISKFRHPIPHGKKIEKYVMVVTCAKRKGLIVAVTRIVHFGKVPDELKRKHRAVTKVDSALILNTEIGKPIGEIFDEGVKMYEECGFPEEWKYHHQGGPTGYQERYFLATSGETRKVQINEPFAWNPSIAGTKSEDTIISSKDGIRIVTEDDNWPLIPVEYKGKTVLRPDILEK